MIDVVNKSKFYYIFNLETNEYVDKVFNLKELINYLSERQATGHQFIKSKYNNTILDNINLTLKDIKFDIMCYLDGENTMGLRKYVVIDGYFRIIDVRQYSDLILNNKVKLDSKRLLKNRYFNDYHIWRMKKKVGDGYKGAIFRREPIPYTNSKFYYPYRQVRVTNEKRKGYDKDIQKYIRSKRKPNNLPNVYYSDIYRHTDSCWKRQSKKRKQWMAL